ncbi:MAG: HD domain-containing protein [Anaerolineales bacterium]|nr:HD domain-containing protein [Anaerolineales bacterium]
MAEPFIPLGEKLRQASPDLADELDMQWKIANNEWLPAMPSSGDSSNSAPHIRNITQHLNELLATLTRHNPKASVLHMRPIEIYLLLASALFHDIGQISMFPGDHGEETRQYLIGNHDALGIRNREVARSLGNICACHTEKPGRKKDDSCGAHLRDVVIDPYGEVRQRMIAALLTLADHMDCAQTRVIPDYLRKTKSIPGNFRNIVQGVFADPAARLVRTVLILENPKEGNGTKENSNQDRQRENPVGPATVKEGVQGEAPRNNQDQLFYIEEKNEDWKWWAHQMEKALRSIPGERLAENLADGKTDIPEGEYTRRLADVFTPFGPEHGKTREDVNQASKLGIIKRRLQKTFGELEHSGPFDLTEQLLAWNIIKIKTKQPERWSNRTLVAIVLGDLRSNREALGNIREHLAAVDLPLASWLIDHEERLYTPDWRESYEPRFYIDYLTEVAGAMWDLSRRVIGASEFTYDELASHMGFHDVGRVRMAVRRIPGLTARLVEASIRREDPEQSRIFPWTNLLWVGEKTWKWRVNARGRGCAFFSLAQVIRCISGLQDP